MEPELRFELTRTLMIHRFVAHRSYAISRSTGTNRRREFDRMRRPGFAIRVTRASKRTLTPITTRTALPNWPAQTCMFEDQNMFEGKTTIRVPSLWMSSRKQIRELGCVDIKEKWIEFDGWGGSRVYVMLIMELQRCKKKRF